MKKISLTTPINQLGFGIVGRNSTLALSALGVEVALWPIGGVTCPDEYRPQVDRALENASRFSTLAPSLTISPPFDLAHHVGKGQHAALTYFERDKFTASEIHYLRSQDVIFASSTWMRELLSGQIHGPKLAIASPGVDARIFHPQLARSSPNNSPSIAPADEWDSMSSQLNHFDRQPSPAPTTFLVVGKWEVRKGHDLLASVFERAFTPQDNFRLV